MLTQKSHEYIFVFSTRPNEFFFSFYFFLIFFVIIFFFFFTFTFISWRLITLHYCSGFVIHWHESAMDLHVFPIPIPPPTSLSTRSLWVFLVHQPQALVSFIQPGLVICFTLDNIHVSMLFLIHLITRSLYPLTDIFPTPWQLSFYCFYEFGVFQSPHISEII